MHSTYLMAAFVMIATTVAEGGVLTTVWTETFDSGVGRFDETLVDGDSLFAWDAASQQIQGDFRRDGQAHRRYADLGQMYDAGDTLGFSAVVTPGARNQDFLPTVIADLAFYNSSLPPEERNNRLGISVKAERDNWGLFSFRGLGDAPQDGPDIRWDEGKTYFIEFLYQGHLDLATWSVYEGVDSSGVLLGTRHNDLTGDPYSLDVDRLGMGGAGTGLLPGQPADAWVMVGIDDFSFIVPGPYTLALCTFGMGFTAARRPSRQRPC